VPVLRQGELIEPLASLEECHRHCAEQVRRLPEELLALEPCPSYPAQVSEELEKELSRLAGLHR
jgi:hypothetical protein